MGRTHFFFFEDRPKAVLYGRDAILRVRDKWLIFNIIIQLWADVKYHVPTRFGFSPQASGFYPFGDAAALPSEGGGIAKRLFFMFLFQSPPSIYPLNGYWKFRRRPMLHMRGAPQ